MEGKSYRTGHNVFAQGTTASALPDIPQRKMYSQAVEIIFNQMHASKGIKMFKERAVAAIFKEYKQLNDMSVLGPIDFDSLSPEEQKQLALDAVNLIKEKRCGKIKGRAFGNAHIFHERKPARLRSR